VDNVDEPGGNAGPEALGKRADARKIAGHILLGDGARGAQSDTERRRERAAAQPAFLAAAADERLEADARAPAHVEGPDALGSIHLVPADGQQICLDGVDVDGDFADSLGGIRVEKYLPMGNGK
jgi:hypothetical protein